MAYTKIVFQNSPSTATPLNAENLNHMDDQIALNDQRLTEIETSYVKSFNGRKGEVVPESGDYNIGQIAPLTGAQVGQVPVVVNHGTEEDPELAFEMGAGGGGGHSIIDSEGSTMPQESAMQFPDSHVSDDSTNGRTVVENVKEVASADYSSETEDGMYLIPDGEGAVIEPASDDYVEVVADGVKTIATLLNELYALADLTKINEKSTINLQWSSSGADTFLLSEKTNANAIFTCCYVSSNTSLTSLKIMDSNSTAKTSVNGTIRDASTDVLGSGYKITLYYGNKKATVDLQTTANRCWYDSNNTVKQKIDGLTNQVKTYSRSTPNLESTTQFTLKPSDLNNQIFTIMGVGSSGTTSMTICNAQGTTLSNLTDKAITKVSFADDILTLSLPSSWYRLIVFSNYPFTLNY